MGLPECDGRDTARGTAPEMTGAATRRRAGGLCRIGLALVSLGILNGCAAIATSQSTGTDPFTTGHELRFTEVNSDRFKPWTDQVPSYRLGPGTRLRSSISLPATWTKT